ncbi:MAG: hypothetical protein AC479_07460 [miscellaneous Crenarchaeota group-6 archaeon AD8-1]|nr:MAG: hypothetical protein AC479_07460 [miscellaneous Crenarchaeota group-6 archaeon AD8-1]
MAQTQDEINQERLNAYDKAMLMTKLFEEKHFTKLTDYMEKKQAANFKNYMKKAVATGGPGCTNKEAEWLWNYLKEYTPDPGGASVSW